MSLRAYRSRRAAELTVVYAERDSFAGLPPDGTGPNRARAWASSAWLRSLISRPPIAEAETATATEPTWSAVIQSGAPLPAARVRTGPSTRAKTRFSPARPAARHRCLLNREA